MVRHRARFEDLKLPKRVYKTKTRYYLKTSSNQTITIGPLEMVISDVWKKYNEIIGKKTSENTFGNLWEQFLKSAYYQELKPRTQEDYLQHQKKLLAVFGNMNPNKIKPAYVRIFMDKRGEQSKTQANHELASMSRVFRWGYERGFVLNNPCVGISKFPANHRDIYIQDEEYYFIYELAIPSIKIAMEISYLCAVREGDIINMQWLQILEDGIYIQQGKTGTKQIKEWNNRLKSIIEYARKHFPPKDQYSLIIKNNTGSQYNRKTFNTHWLNAKRKAEEVLNKKLNIHFHDIKAKGISDFEGSSRDKQLFSGHKTESQVLIYDRKIKLSPTLNLPKINKK